MVNASNATVGISSLAENLMDLLHFWKDWPIPAQYMLLFGVIFGVLSFIVLTYGMKIHGLSWSDAGKK